MGFHGYFVWHELMSKDPASAKLFYPAALGWEVEAAEIPGMQYDMWRTSRGPIGGVWQLPPEAQDAGAPSHWIPYVGTADIDAGFARAQALGGGVYVPVTDIPGIGRFAVLRDPQGATFALYQPLQGEAGDVRPGIGDFSWHELATSDAVAALAFYGDLFGWTEVQASDMGAMGMYRIFGRDGHMFGGMFDKPADMPMPSNWCSYVRVENVQDAVGRITQGGGTVLNGPMEVPGGDVIAQCLDPQGAYFAVHAMPE